MNCETTYETEQRRLADLKGELKTLKSQLAAAKTAQEDWGRSYVASKVAGNDLPKQPKDNRDAIEKEIAMLESAIKIQEGVFSDAAKAWTTFKTHVAASERQHNIDRAVGLVRELQRIVVADQKYVAEHRRQGVELKEHMVLPAGCEHWVKMWGSK